MAGPGANTFGTVDRLPSPLTAHLGHWQAHEPTAAFQPKPKFKLRQYRKNRVLDSVGGAIRVARIKRRIWIVFDAQLNCLGHGLASNPGDDAQAKIDA